MQYRPEIGHALANFADAAILSFKYRFAHFQQVPAGSDYLSFRSILHKSLQGIFFTLVRDSLCFEPIQL